jgi:hypothetical protein
MDASNHSDSSMRSFHWIAGALLLAGFLITGWIGARGGIGSLDAQSIIHVATERAQSGKFDMSRPPGHPLNEYWMLPEIIRFTSLGATPPTLSSFGYGLYQMAGGIFCLVLFWLLLAQFSLSATRRLLAMACLAFTPQFLITSSEGEEFLWGMGLVFVSVLLLAKLSKGEYRHPLAVWCLCIASAAAASGYRLEYGAVALLTVFTTLLVSDQSCPRRLGLGLFAILVLLAIWSPILTHQGVAPPYDIPINLKTRLGVGLYKIVFLAMGAVPFLIGLTFIAQSRGSIRIVPPFGKNILDYWALWLALIFFALFFVYPSKILVVLPGVAFLILLGAVHAGRWTWALFVMASMSLLFVHLDVFKDRRWTGLKFQPSLWTQSYGEKPAGLRPRANAAAQMASTGRHLVIVDMWPWTLAWQHDNAAWPGVGDPASIDQSGVPQVYFIGPGAVATRSVIDNHKTVAADYAQKGYDIWIDENVYRQMFMRYNLSAPTPETAVIQGVTFHIVSIQ